MRYELFVFAARCIMTFRKTWFLHHDSSPCATVRRGNLYLRLALSSMPRQNGLYLRHKTRYVFDPQVTAPVQVYLV